MRRSGQTFVEFNRGRLEAQRARDLEILAAARAVVAAGECATILALATRLGLPNTTIQHARVRLRLSGEWDMPAGVGGGPLRLTPEEARDHRRERSRLKKLRRRHRLRAEQDERIERDPPPDEVAAIEARIVQARREKDESYRSGLAPRPDGPCRVYRVHI